MAEPQVKPKLEKLVPLLAAEEAVKADPEFMSLLRKVVERELREWEEEEDRRRKIAKASADQAEEIMRIRKEEQDRCSHRKFNGEPRTGGQMLSNGQVCIVCLYCGKEWHNPPAKDQEACPPSLMPHPDLIGG